MPARNNTIKRKTNYTNFNSDTNRDHDRDRNRRFTSFNNNNNNNIDNDTNDDDNNNKPNPKKVLNRYYQPKVGVRVNKASKPIPLDTKTPKRSNLYPDLDCSINTTEIAAKDKENLQEYSRLTLEYFMKQQLSSFFYHPETWKNFRFLNQHLLKPGVVKREISLEFQRTEDFLQTIWESTEKCYQEFVTKLYEVIPNESYYFFKFNVCIRQTNKQASKQTHTILTN